MITRRVPDGWQDLQNQVARILSECGFKADTERTVETSRGRVELDVYAEEIVGGRRYSIIVECKHWRQAVPQNVVHGFRTVVGDIGANIGYVVSLNGFQAGAYEARGSTNVELVTWPEFQNAFFETWYDKHFSPTITEKLDGLFSYSEPFLPAWFSTMSAEDQDRYRNCCERFDVFGIAMMTFTTYVRVVNQARVALPLAERLAADPERDKIPEHILRETHYREFLDAVLDYGHYAYSQYDEFRQKYVRD